MSKPVRTTPLADLHILELDAWWRQHREKAPDLRLAQRGVCLEHRLPRPRSCVVSRRSGSSSCVRGASTHGRAGRTPSSSSASSPGIARRCGRSWWRGASAFRCGIRAVERWLESRLETVRFGGTAGAYRLEPHYRGPLTVVHLDAPPSERMRRRLKAAPANDGELVWMGHIGRASHKGETTDTVHPLLIYAELVSDPDPRAAEAAELIRERWLPWSL